MAIELITAEEVAALPDGAPGFLAFEAICRDRLNVQLNRGLSVDADRPYRASYLSSVSAAATEYGVDPDGLLASGRFEKEGFNGDTYTDYEAFEITVRGLTTRIQIQAARTRRAGELSLSTTDQRKVEHHIQALRERIAAEPSIPEAKRKTLNKKLDELLANLNGKKVDLAKTMVIVGSFFVALDRAEAALIKLPETIGSIAKVVTMAKEYQDSLLPLPPPEPKRIVHQPAKPKATGPRESFAADLDDEIPF